MQGVSVSCRGFTDNLPVEEDLPIENIIHDYACPSRGETILLHTNYCIYMVNKK